VQVLSIQILLQTSLNIPHFLLPSMMFVLVLVPHVFFGQADLAEQVEAREHPAYLMSYL
jgi:hypothetical protein